VASAASLPLPVSVSLPRLSVPPALNYMLSYPSPWHRRYELLSDYLLWGGPHRALTSIMMGEAAGQKQQQRAGENTFEESLQQLQQRRGRASNENVP
jgi:hypothetical protein